MIIDTTQTRIERKLNRQSLPRTKWVPDYCNGKRFGSVFCEDAFIEPENIVVVQCMQCGKKYETECSNSTFWCSTDCRIAAPDGNYC